MNTCTFNGDICISMNICANSTLSESLCQTIKGTDGDCWNVGIGNGPCKLRSCSDVFSPTSVTLCSTHKSTCRYTGSGCIDVPSTCGGMTGTPDACQNLVLADPNKTKCWNNGSITEACKNRSCS